MLCYGYITWCWNMNYWHLQTEQLLWSLATILQSRKIFLVLSKGWICSNYLYFNHIQSQYLSDIFIGFLALYQSIFHHIELHYTAYCCFYLVPRVHFSGWYTIWSAVVAWLSNLPTHNCSLAKATIDTHQSVPNNFKLESSCELENWKVLNK